MDTLLKTPGMVGILFALTAVMMAVGFTLSGGRATRGQPSLRVFDSLGDGARRLLVGWLVLALCIGFLVPGVVLFAYRHDMGVVALIVPLMAGMLVQVASEGILTQYFGVDMSPMVGVLHTLFRLAQLGCGFAVLERSALDAEAREAVSHFIIAGLAFWSLHALYLMAVGVPRGVELARAARGLVRRRL